MERDNRFYSIGRIDVIRHISRLQRATTRERVTMVTPILRVINLLGWVGLTSFIWYAVDPNTIELLLGIALNSFLCLTTDYLIRVIGSELAKGA